MPTVTWVKDATTITFPRGNVRGPHRFENVSVVEQRLAGGAVAAYELSGMTDREVIDFELPHLTGALRDAVKNFKASVVKNQLATFTFTDNSESPPAVYVVRLDPEAFTIVPEQYTDPTAPRFTLRGRVKVEPA